MRRRCRRSRWRPGGRRLCALAADGERAALVAALDGRRVAPGPAGAPSRGRADVLPTGRNLTSIDPRAIPTRTAAAIGMRAADEVVRRYLQDHGEHPRALVIDLWASASLRTGGDDLAQALAYLGVQPTWDKASSRVTGIEMMPLAVLDRPRIDVTLRISGLFRDIFETQIALFDMAVRRVAELDEDGRRQSAGRGAPPRRRSRARVRRRARQLRRAGRRRGARRRLADPRRTGRGLSRRGHACLWRWRAGARGGRGLPRLASPRPTCWSIRRTTASAIFWTATASPISPAASRRRRRCWATTPELYHLDTSQPEAPKARRIAEEIARVVRGRLTNPRWIAGMLAHGHRGVAEIAQGVDALYAFAATTRVPCPVICSTRRTPP